MGFPFVVYPATESVLSGWVGAVERIENITRLYDNDPASCSGVIISGDNLLFQKVMTSHEPTIRLCAITQGLDFVESCGPIGSMFLMDNSDLYSTPNSLFSGSKTRRCRLVGGNGNQTEHECACEAPGCDVISLHVPRHIVARKTLMLCEIFWCWGTQGTPKLYYHETLFW